MDKKIKRSVMAMVIAGSLLNCADAAVFDPAGGVPFGVGNGAIFGPVPTWTPPPSLSTWTWTPSPSPSMLSNVGPRFDPCNPFSELAFEDAWGRCQLNGPPRNHWEKVVAMENHMRDQAEQHKKVIHIKDTVRKLIELEYWGPEPDDSDPLSCLDDPDFLSSCGGRYRSEAFSIHRAAKFNPILENSYKEAKRSGVLTNGEEVIEIIKRDLVRKDLLQQVLWNEPTPTPTPRLRPTLTPTPAPTPTPTPMPWLMLAPTPTPAPSLLRRAWNRVHFW